MSFKTKTVGTENLPDSSVGQMSAAQACASKFDFHSRHMLLQCGALASQSKQILRGPVSRVKHLTLISCLHIDLHIHCMDYTYTHKHTDTYN